MRAVAMASTLVFAGKGLQIIRISRGGWLIRGSRACRSIRIRLWRRGFSWRVGHRRFRCLRGVGGSRRRGGWGISPRRRARHLVHADAWTVLRPSLELLLEKHPCFIQAAGERYPTHLADAETNAESAGHEEWLYPTTLSLTTVLLDRSLHPRQLESSASTKNSGGWQHKRTLRRRLVGPTSFRQLNKTGTFFTVGSSRASMR